MTKTETSSLEFVPAENRVTLSDQGIIWRSAVNNVLTECTDFEFGEATLETGYSSSIIPSSYSQYKEAFIMIQSGTAVIITENIETEVRKHDCVFVPSDRGCQIQNKGTSPVDFLWGIANHEKEPLLGNNKPNKNPDSVQIINTHRELTPSVTLERGSTLRHWAPVFPESVGSQQLNLGLFQRPPGSSIPLHGHNPPTITEAFTVLEGRLLIEDHDGVQHILEKGDFLYVPQGGKHNNKNIGSGTVTYACVETPARSNDISPVDKESI